MNLPAITGIISIIIGIVYSISAYNLPRATVGDPMAPVKYPLGLGIAMTVFGIILFIKEIKQGELINKESIKTKGIMPSTKLIIITCISSIAYAILFERIGYVLSTMLFIGSILFALNGKQKWKTNVIVSICFSVGVYVIFLKLLNIPLPLMPLLEI